MFIHIKRIILLLWIICLPIPTVFSQHSSKDNYTGAWDVSSSWNPTWPVPETNISGYNITINGYITVYSSLSFSGSPTNLIINDTLVIKGDLTLDNNNDLTINDNGILIVRGNLTIGNQSKIIANGYIIVTGNFNKDTSINQGSFTSNDDPVKVFIGGTIASVGITTDPAYPVLNCNPPITIPYPHSNCSYGDMTDIINDPIYPFFQTTCIIASSTITAGGPTTFCDGGSVTLTSSPGITYVWSNGATTPSINVTKSGSYTVQITNSSGCLSAPSAAAIVTVNSLPITPTITAGGPTAFCAGDSVILTSSTGTSYLWSNGATTQGISVTASDSYTVKITDASGCQSAASVATIVTVNALPVTPTITASGTTTFCTGGSVTLTSSAGTTYLWSTGATTASINVTAAGSYTVQVTDANGCQSAVSAGTIVDVSALLVVNAGTDTTIPNGTSTTINATVTGTGPFIYSWSPSAQLLDASVKDPTTVNLAATTIFSLTATSLTTTCSKTDEVIITVSGGALNSTPTATPGTICAGANVQLYAIASGGSGSYTYTWTSIPGGFTSSFADPIASPMVNTTYQVAVFDGFTTVNSQVAVTVNAVPAIPAVTAGGPTTFCSGGSVNLTSGSGTSYLWSNGATTPDINVTTTGSYTVQVTNSNGCLSAVSAATVVIVNTVPVTPTITAGGPTTFCEGSSVTLTSSAGTSYLWSNGATTQSINATNSGSYTVQSKNASGCQSAVSVATIVTANTLPLTPTITAESPTTFCDGDVVTLTSSAGISYLWSNGATLPGINVTVTGSYTVQVSNTNGCQSAASAPTSIVVNALPVASASNNGPVCAGSALSLTGGPAGMTIYYWMGPGGFTSLLQNPSVSDSATLDMAGDYTLIVTDNNGCTNKKIENVIVNETPVAIAGPEQELKFNFETQMDAELSASETGEWSLISGSGHISDIHSPTTRVTELSVGENKFLWKVLNASCEDTAEVKITVYDLFVPSVITPNGDGKNDCFKISEFTGRVELIIFNRWGNEEYTNGNYLNDWDGRNNKGAELPNDTYFYVLKFENGKIKKGSVLIKR